MLALRVGLQLDQACFRVYVEHSAHIQDVIALACIVEELGHISVLQVLLIELLHSEEIDDAALSVAQPPFPVHGPPQLVNKLPLFALLNEGLLGASVQQEVAAKLEGVEVVALHAEGSGDLASFVDFVLLEHLLLLVLLNDVACRRVNQVPALVHAPALLIDVVAVFVLEQDKVPLLVDIEVAQDVVLVEAALPSVGRHLDDGVFCCWLEEMDLFCLLLGALLLYLSHLPLHLASGLGGLGSLLLAFVDLLDDSEGIVVRDLEV